MAGQILHCTSLLPTTFLTSLATRPCMSCLPSPQRKFESNCTGTLYVPKGGVTTATSPFPTCLHVIWHSESATWVIISKAKHTPQMNTHLSFLQLLFFSGESGFFFVNRVQTNFAWTSVQPNSNTERCNTTHTHKAMAEARPRVTWNKVATVSHIVDDVVAASGALVTRPKTCPLEEVGRGKSSGANVEDTPLMRMLRKKSLRELRGSPEYKLLPSGLDKARLKKSDLCEIIYDHIVALSATSPA